MQVNRLELSIEPSGAEILGYCSYRSIKYPNFEGSSSDVVTGLKLRPT